MVVGEVTVGGDLRELGLLQTRYKNFLVVQQLTKLVSAALDAVAVELKKGASTVCGGACTAGCRSSITPPRTWGR